MSQKEIVFKAVSEATEVTPGTAVVFKDLDKSVKTQIVQEVASKIIEQGAISEKAAIKYPTVTDLIKLYVPGLVNNHIRKDLRLNGGEPYKAANPGSRQSDKELKNLKLLLSQVAAVNPEDENIEAIEEAIEARQATLTAAKAKTAQVDLSAINPDLLKKLNMVGDSDEMPVAE